MDCVLHLFCRSFEFDGVPRPLIAWTGSRQTECSLQLANDMPTIRERSVGIRAHDASRQPCSRTDGRICPSANTRVLLRCQRRPPKRGGAMQDQAAWPHQRKRANQLVKICDSQPGPCLPASSQTTIPVRQLRVKTRGQEVHASRAAAGLMPPAGAARMDAQLLGLQARQDALRLAACQGRADQIGGQQGHSSACSRTAFSKTVVSLARSRGSPRLTRRSSGPAGVRPNMLHCSRP